LDAATLARLKALLDERQGIANNEAEIARLQQERDAIYRQQEQLRQNMAALGQSGEEGALRKTLFAQLGAGIARVSEIDARIAALNADSQARQARIEAELKRLGS
jgi:uncharacterized small protein (DUF1192 family)